MFESFENKPEEPKWIGPKMLVVAAAGILLSFGLCGFGLVLHIGGGLGLLGVFGACLMVISVLAIVIGGIVTLVEVIIANSRGK